MSTAARDGAAARALRELVDLTVVVDPLYNENCYILHRRDTDRCLVIDPGLQHARALIELERQALRCERILATHGHADHVSGIPALREAHGCPAAIHPDDRWMLDHVRLFPNIPADLPDVVCDEDLDPGSMVRWQGLELAILPTPGHSPGSVSFLLGEDLFAGDTLFHRSVGRADLPGGSWATLMFSIEHTLFTLPPQTVVLPGHGERTTIEAEMRDNPFVGRGSR